MVRHDDGQDVEYRLTQAGEELRPVVELLGVWGMRWVGELGDVDLDPKLLLWDLHRNVDPALVPPGRTVVAFNFVDVPSKLRDWWLVLTPEAVDVCDFDPGYEVAVSVTGSLRRMVEIWRGDLGWPEALRSGAVTLHGAEPFRRALPTWLPPSRFAAVPRPAARSAEPRLADHRRRSQAGKPQAVITPWSLFSSVLMVILRGFAFSATGTSSRSTPSR